MREGVTLLTNAGIAACLIPTSSILFIFCQQWQINRKPFSWCPADYKNTSPQLAVFQRNSVFGTISSATGPVVEGLQTRASLGPWSEGWMGWIYHRKGWLHIRSEMGHWAHLPWPHPRQIIFPTPVSIWLNYHNVAGKISALQEHRNNSWRMPLSVHRTARAHSTASCQALIPSARKAALIPAHTQITASAMDHSILGDLHKMLTGFQGREKHFSFCQCKQLARSRFGCVQLKRRAKQDSAPKTYLNWLWEVGMYMPVGLSIRNVICFHSLGTTSLLSTILPWAAKPD